MIIDKPLWPACVKSHGFADQLRAAAAGGFDSLPIGPLTYKSLREQGLSPADMVAMAGGEGIRLGHYDGFSDWAPLRLGANLPEAARAVFDVSSDQCLEICQQLGLEAICATGAFAVGEVEVPALADGFAAFCERAAVVSIRVDLEFIPMWGIPDLETAWEIVRRADCSNGGILFDSWHFFRGRPDMTLLRQLPAGTIATVQVADAATDLQGADLFEDCMRYRRLPGDGDFPLTEALAILRDKGGVTSLGPEVFSDQLDALAADEAGRRAGAATRRIAAAAGLA